MSGDEIFGRRLVMKYIYFYFVLIIHLSALGTRIKLFN